VVAVIATALITRSIMKFNFRWESGRLSATAQGREYALRYKIQTLEGQRYFGLCQAMKMADFITNKGQAATVFRLLEVLGYENHILLGANSILPHLDAATRADEQRIQALNEEITRLEFRINDRASECHMTRAFVGLFEGLEVPAPEQPGEDKHVEVA
jgi:hypothetical protein